MLRLTSVAAAALAVALVSSTARADDEVGPLTALEVSVGLGNMSQMTTGVGEPLLGRGYDRSPGPLAEAGAVLLFGHDHYIRHGLTLRGGYHAGRGFGRRGYGFRFGIADAAYTFRGNLPCMSHGSRQMFVEASFGVSGGFADAGTGRGPMGDDENIRRVASEELDHGMLGWVLGLGFDAHFGAATVGLHTDLRRLFGIDTVADRHFFGAVVLRAGFALDFLDSRD